MKSSILGHGTCEDCGGTVSNVALDKFGGKCMECASTRYGNY